MSTEMHDLNERLVDEEEGYLEVGEDGEKQGYFAVSESERAPSKIKVCGVSVCLVGWLVVCLFVCVFVCLFVCLVVCLFVCLFGWLVGQWSRPPCAHMPGCCFCFSKPFAPLHCCVQLHRSVDAEHLLRSRGKGAFLIKLCTSNPDAAFNLGTRQCFCLSVCVQ